MELARRQPDRDSTQGKRFVMVAVLLAVILLSVATAQESTPPDPSAAV